jgi:conjugal transfer pilus assembly protein TrbC
MAARIRAAAARADRQADRMIRQSASPYRIDTDRIPLPLVSARPPDIEALARRLGAEAPAQHAAAMQRPTLLAFMSFAMPKASLQRLASDASTLGATLVLRGLVGDDFKATQRALTEIIGERKVGVLIDPEAYERFGVTATPTYVLVRAGAEARGCEAGQCFDDADFVRLSGDVPLAYVLQTIEARVPDFAAEVAAFRRGP